MHRVLIATILSLVSAGIVTACAQHNADVPATGQMSAGVDTSANVVVESTHSKADTLALSPGETSESDARTAVESAMPQVMTATNVVARLVTRNDVDTILGVKRFDRPGYNSSTDRVWLLAYEAGDSGFTDLGSLVLGDNGANNPPQPVAYFLVDANTKRISAFGLLADRSKMETFSQLADTSR